MVFGSWASFEILGVGVKNNVASFRLYLEALVLIGRRLGREKGFTFKLFSRRQISQMFTEILDLVKSLKSAIIDISMANQKVWRCPLGAKLAGQNLFNPENMNGIAFLLP